ncbi:MAG: hypothetical protein GY754_29020 [bacterium]|nr:hypothetical protein [bacterium]
MKKVFVIMVFVLLMGALPGSSLLARGVILKGGYSMPLYDLADFKDTWNLGLYFDSGSFLMESVKFVAGFEFFQIESNKGEFASIYCIHLEWQWNPFDIMISPYIGLGPSLNYFDWGLSQHEEDDSDVGIEGFIGAGYRFTAIPLEVFLETRYKFLDISDRDNTVLVFNLGVEFFF